jgi:hydrogenase maturation factor
MTLRAADNALSLGKLPSELLGALIGSLGARDGDVIIGPGIGRDAAAVRIGNEILVLKTDPITFASSGAGRYLINVNANDLACLGATPSWMLVTAMFPLGTTQADVAASFDDLSVAAAERGISLVGGHTEITSAVTRPVLVGMLAGLAAESRFLPPGGARAGDLLVLSRPVAVEGTALLAGEQRQLLTGLLGEELVDQAERLLTHPGISVSHDARLVLDAMPVHALHDPTEGGIATGAREIAAASGLAIELNGDAIPILSETAAIAAALELDPLGMLASGSLLLACDPADAEQALSIWRDSGAQPAIVGRFVEPERGHTLLSHDECRELPEFHLDEVSRVLREIESSSVD